MLKRITIDSVNDLPLAQVMSTYVDGLKKNGASYKAKSPFTEEKTASFVVTPSKGIWKCFSTGKGGSTAIGFLMEKESLSFFEAVKRIADDHGIPLEMDDSENARKYVETAEKRREIHEVNAAALEYFLDNVASIPKSKKNRATDAMYEKFAIGYAPEGWSGLMNFLMEKGFSKERMANAGLIKKHKTKDHYFDVFRERVMFPVYSTRGEISGFSGYDVTGKNDAKYLNTRSTLAYNKSTAVLGLFQSKEDIVRMGYASVAEGNYDVPSLHSQMMLNAVAPLGALTSDHAHAISKYTDQALLFIDNDKHGLGFIEKNTILFLKEGINVMLFIPEEEGMDPDDLVKSKKWKKREFLNEIDEKSVEAIHYLAKVYFEKTKTVFEENAAIQKLGRLISKVQDNQLRNAYVKKYSRLYKVDKASVEQQVSLNVVTKKSTVQDESGVKLPSYLRDNEMSNYKIFGFYEDRSSDDKLGYWFPGANSVTERMTNFVIEPIFQIESGQNDSKRVMKLINAKNRRSNKEVIIEISNKGFVSNTIFEETVQNQGNYWFNGSRKQFQKLKVKLLPEFAKYYEIKTLGWQKRGFFAFADGVIEEQRFKQVDSYGGCRHGDDDFFLPAFSKLYDNSDVEDDLYESERALVYRPGNVNMKEWASKMHRVHGKNGMWASLILISILFRDFIFKTLQYFPIPFMFGPIQTGKSTCARSINSVFFVNQPPFNLSTGTNVGFHRKLSRTANTPAWFDEYSNDIDMVRFQAIKGTFDGAGHERGIMSQDNRTKTTKINAVPILSGQFIPSLDDSSLLSRNILLSFHTKPSDRSQKDIDEFVELQSWEQHGLSNLIVEIVRFRDLFESKFTIGFSEAASNLKQLIGEKQYEGRILNSYSILVACFLMLKEKLNLPFENSIVLNSAVSQILEQSDMVQDTNALRGFWKTIEFMSQQGYIHEGVHYIIQEASSVKVREEKTDKSKDVSFGKIQRILLLRFNQVYLLYTKSHIDLYREKGLDESSIKSYIKHSKYFYGVKKAQKFDGTNTSAHVFRYDDLGISMKTSLVTPEPQETSTLQTSIV